MRPCLLLLLLGSACSAFSPPAPSRRLPTTQLKEAKQTIVQVCGFKDCKRAGGGPRLEKFLAQVIQEEGKEDNFQIEACECQGECGYGPNVVVDGRLINNVRGREAVLQALGVESSS